MNRFLTIISFFCVGFAFGSVIWIVVPSPSSAIWLYSVAVSEWSLWFAILAFLGIFCAFGNYIYFKKGYPLAVSIIGSIALLIALYPYFSILPEARLKNVELSFTQYFNGLTNRYTLKNSPQTFVFNKTNNLKLDVYEPPDNVLSNGASIIVIHGGSWNAGNRSDFPQWNEWLAANGYTVFDIDYRLKPQPNYSTAITDVKCAVQWVKENSAKFNLAPEKIALLGRSAGAHLALISGYTANDTRLPSSCEVNNFDEKVRAVIAFYAPTDLLWSYENPSNPFVIDSKKTLGDFIGGNPHESAEILEKYKLVSPSANVNRQTPPTLLIHGGQDQLVNKENLDILAAQLAEQGVLYQTIFIPSAQHGFDYNFNGWGSQLTKPQILDFLKAVFSK